MNYNNIQTNTKGKEIKLDRPRLRKVRMEAGLRQREMAERLSVSLSHYKNIEAGFSEPSLGVVRRFAVEFPRYAKDALIVFQKEEKKARAETKIIDVDAPVSIEYGINIETDWREDE